ncbi:MAG: DUF1232 domain-containing protein [Thermoanaerobaculia bacterium]
MSENEFSEAMADSSGPVSKDRAERYYDRVRRSIATYLERKGKALGKSGEFLLIVPDVFMLLWRLVNDSRVNGKNKVLLGSGIAYYLFPLDLIPEAIIGPVGYLDDLVLAVYMLNRVIGDTDPEVLRQHWSGSEDVLRVIQNILNSADNLVGSDVLTKLKKMVGK